MDKIINYKIQTVNTDGLTNERILQSVESLDIKNLQKIKLSKEINGIENPITGFMVIRSEKNMEIVFEDGTVLTIESFFGYEGKEISFVDNTDNLVQITSKLLENFSQEELKQTLLYSQNSTKTIKTEQELITKIDKEIQQIHEESSEIEEIIEEKREEIKAEIEGDKTSYLYYTLGGLGLLGGLLALGGGGGSSSTTPAPQQDPETQTGFFIDSAVSGISYYVNGVYAGKTGVDGSFNYFEGDVVSFKVQNIQIGQINTNNIPSDLKVFPQDLVGVSRDEVSDETVVKIIQVLQTLDSNGNPYDGIQITTDTETKLENTTVNIEDVTVEDIIIDTQEHTIVNKEEAIEHLTNTVSKTEQTNTYVTIKYSSDKILKNETSTVTFTFMKSNYDFDLGQVSMEGGSLANLSTGFVNEVNGTTTYTAEFTPDDNTENLTTKEISFISDLIKPTYFDYIIDTNVPVIENIDFVSETNYKVGDEFKIKFETTEPNLKLSDTFVSTILGQTITNVVNTEVKNGENYIYEASFVIEENTINKLSTEDTTYVFNFEDPNGNIVPTIDTVLLDNNQTTIIDSVKPIITGISLNNIPLKIGDLGVVTISATEQEISIKEGSTIAGYNLSNLTYVDSVVQDGQIVYNYQANITITEDNQFITSTENLQTNIILLDKVGNETATYTSDIVNNSDQIDAKRPEIEEITLLQSVGSQTQDVVLNVKFSETVSNFSETFITSSWTPTNVTVSTEDLINWQVTLTVPTDTLLENATVNIEPNIILDGTLYTIEDSNGNTVSQEDLTLKVTSPEFTIDSVSPQIDSISSLKSGTLLVGEEQKILVQFTKEVTNFSLEDIAVTYGTISNLTTEDNILYSFDYVPNVIEGVTETIVVSTDIEDLNGNSLTSNIYNNNLTFGVDNVTSNIQTIEVSSTTGEVNSTLNLNDTIEFTVTMNSPVIVTSPNPTLALNIGEGTVYANYVNQPTTDTILFRYTITTQNDLDGIQIPQNPIELNGGSIKDLSGNDIDLTSVLVSLDKKVDTTLATGEIISTSVISNEGTLSINVSETGTAYLVKNTISFSTPTDLDDKDPSLYKVITINEGEQNINLPVTPTGLVDGTYVLYVVDNAGNISNVSQSNVIIDSAAPSITSITVQEGQYKPGDELLVTINATEDNLDFTGVRLGGYNYNDLVINNIGGGVYTTIITIQETSLSSNSSGYMIDNNVVFKDLANISGSYVSDIKLTDLSYIDTTLPYVETIEINDVTLNSTSTTTQVTITFSEKVLDFDLTDISQSFEGNNGVLSNLQTSDEGKTWTLDYTANNLISATDVLTILPTYTDTIGNSASISKSSPMISIDTTLPTVTKIEITDNKLLAGEETLMKITFSEKVKDFAIEDIVVVNGTITDLFTLDNKTFYTTIKATEAQGVSSTDSIITIKNTFSDLNDNAMTQDFLSDSFETPVTLTIDTEKPTVSNITITTESEINIVDSKNYLNKDDIIVVNLEMTEEVIVTGTPKITIDLDGTQVVISYNGLLNEPTTTLTFSYIIPEGLNLTNPISVQQDSLALENSTIKDTVGNYIDKDLSNIVLNPTFTSDYYIDSQLPVISTESADFTISTNNVDSQSYAQTGEEVTFVFKSTKELVIENFIIDVAGTLIDTANISYNSTTQEYSFVYVVTGEEVPVDQTSVVLPFSIKSTDLFGNLTNEVTNEDFTTTNVITVDNSAPIGAIISTAEGVVNTNVVFNIEFSEKVTSFTVEDLIITNGTIKDAVINTVELGLSYTVEIIPDKIEGDIEVKINPSSFKDFAGNLNTVEISQTQTVDTLGPNPTIQSNYEGISTNQEVTYTIVFPQTVENISDSMFTVLNGTITQSVVEVSPNDGTTYELKVTANDNFTGTIGLTFNQNQLQDEIGNYNDDVTHLQLVDNINPSIISTTPNDDSQSISPNDPIVIQFDEEIFADSGNITIVNTITNEEIVIDVTSDEVVVIGDTVTITPTTQTMVIDVPYAVKIEQTAFKDASDNNFAGITDLTTFNFTTEDLVGPEIEEITMISQNSTYGVKDAETVTLSFKSNEELDETASTVTILANTVSITKVDALNYTATYTINGQEDQEVTFTIDAVDLLGNSATQTYTQTTDNKVVKVDNTAPIIETISSPIKSGNEDEAVNITFTELVSNINITDATTISKIKVSNITEGTLLINGNPYAADTNDTIVLGDTLSWTGDLNTEGIKYPFDIAVYDQALNLSTSQTIQINLSNTNDAFEITATEITLNSLVENFDYTSISNITSITDIDTIDNLVKKVELNVSNVLDSSNEYLNIEGEIIDITQDSVEITMSSGNKYIINFDEETNSSNIVVTYSANKTITDTIAYVNSITYKNTSEDPTSTTKEITLDLIDNVNLKTQSSTLLTTISPITQTNDTPTSQNQSMVTNEDTEILFSVSDSLYNDVDSADSLKEIIITNFVGNGTFYVTDGISWDSLDQGTQVPYTITLADIEGGFVKFVPNAEESGISYATISYKVVDDSLSANDTSSEYTMQINVTNIDDSPVIDVINLTETVNDNSGASSLFGEIELSDVDTNLLTLTITQKLGDSTTVDNTYTQGNITGTTFTSSENGVYILKDKTAAELQTILDSLVYNPKNNKQDMAPSDTYDTVFEFVLSDGNTQTETITKTVTVTAINDAPVIATPLVDTNATEDVLFELDISSNFVDLDGIDQLTYSITNNPGWLSIDSQTGVISGTPTNSDVTEGVTVTVTATDSAGEFINDDIIIAVINTNDIPTAVVLDNYDISELTDTSSSPFVVANLSTTDDDTNDEYTYSIVGGANSTLFEIDNINGQVLLKQGVVLDYETKTNYEIIIRTDDGNSTYDETVTINITDQNETPTFTKNQMYVLEGETVTLTTDMINLKDQDTDTLNSEIKLILISVTSGTFKNDGVTVTPGIGEFSLQDIIDGKVTFEHDGTLDAPTVTLKQKDTDGAIATSSTPMAITFYSLPEVTSVSVPTDKTYLAGEEMVFKVIFDEDINVITTNGTPTIEITVGDQTKYATYYVDETNASNELSFKYIVEEEDNESSNDIDGITLGSNIILNNGIIESTNNIQIDTTLNSIAPTTGILIDATVPDVTFNLVNDSEQTVSLDNSTSIKLDSNIELVFSENVTSVEGKNIYLHLGYNGSIVETFTLTGTSVVNGNTLSLDPTTNFISNTSYYITYDEGAFVDANGNVTLGSLSTTALNFSTLDNEAPVINTVSISADGENTEYAKEGSEITISFTTNEELDVASSVVNVLGNSAVITKVGDNSYQATYTIQQADVETNSITFDITVYDLSGNFNQKVVTTTTDGTSVVLDKTATTAPLALDLITEDDLGSSNVDNFTSIYTPTITGTGSEEGNKITLYDTDGITVIGTGVVQSDLSWSITTSSLIDADHTITATETDLAGNESDASVGLNITIETTNPYLQAIYSDQDGSYKQGDSIQINAQFSENIVQGSQITMTLSNGDQIVLTAQEAGNILTGTYTIGEGDSTVGELLNVTSFTKGDAIDTFGNEIITTTIPEGNNLADNNSIYVDLEVPTIDSFTSFGKTYKIGESISITMNFNEDIVYDNALGEAQITLNSGHVLTAVSSTLNSVTFSLNIVENTGDLDGIEVSSIDLGNSVITDLAGNLLDKTTDGVITTTNEVGINIVSDRPTITDITILEETGIYKAQDELTISATMSKSIALVGNVTVTLNNGKEVVLTPSADGLKLEGIYTVVVNDDISNLTVTSYVVSGITDTVGNTMTDATLPLTNIDDNKSIEIDTIPPTKPTIQSLETNDTTPILNGTFDSINTETLEVTINSVTYVLGTDANLTTDGNSWSLALETELVEGKYEVLVETTDLAGNKSSDTTTNELEIDVTPPSIVAVDFVRSQDGTTGTLTITTNEVIGGSTIVQLKGGESSISGSVSKNENTITVTFNGTDFDTYANDYYYTIFLSDDNGNTAYVEGTPLLAGYNDSESFTNESVSAIRNYGEGKDTISFDTEVNLNIADYMANNLILDNLEVIDISGNGVDTITNVTETIVKDITDGDNTLFIQKDTTDSVDLTGWTKVEGVTGMYTSGDATVVLSNEDNVII